MSELWMDYVQSVARIEMSIKKLAQSGPAPYVPSSTDRFRQLIAHTVVIRRLDDTHERE